MEEHHLTRAFTKATDAKEAWRRQQITALTDLQRKDYDHLKTAHETQRDDLKRDQQEQRREQLIARMKELVLDEPRPAHTRHYEAHPSNIDQLQARRAVEDFVDGRPSKTVKRHEHTLAGAQATANQQIEHENGIKRLELIGKQQHEMDDRLRGWQKERQLARERSEQRSAERQENARDITQERSAEKTKEPSLGDGWRRAVEKASEKEHDRPHDLSEEFDKRR
jgi:hypothetical protein